MSAIVGAALFVRAAASINEEGGLGGPLLQNPVTHCDSAHDFVLDRVRNQIRADEVELAEADFGGTEEVAVGH